MDFEVPNNVDAALSAAQLLDVLLVICALSLAAAAVWRLIDLLRRYRGTQIVECPENHHTASVHVDSIKAAFTGIGQTPVLRLSQCSRWPEMEGCGQQCLKQIETSPELCLLHNVMAGWYKGKTCIYCGVPLSESSWLENRPGLRSPDGRQLTWGDFPPESVYEVLATHEPVCYNCHIAEKFRLEHPDLVIERRR